MKHPATAAFTACAVIAAMPASAQQSSKAAVSAKVAAAVPVPRTDFIRTMDGEFAKMDLDKNKIVTRDEIEQFQRTASLVLSRERARALFAKMDADKNGQLSLAEFEPMAITTPRANAAPILVQHDLNKDGGITLVEYRTAKLANFDRMDADKDGVVSIVEMRAAGLLK